MHDAIMAKEEKVVIKTKITRQWPGNFQMQRMGEECADKENGLHPAWKEMHRLDSRHEQAGSQQTSSFQEKYCWSA